MNNNEISTHPMNTEATAETQSAEHVDAPPKLVDLDLIAPEDSSPHSFANEYRKRAAIKISEIKQDGSYQFRAATNPSRVAEMQGLIRDEIRFTTPIRLLTGMWPSLDIIDGHHRVEAYKSLGHTEIPIDQIEIIETRSYAAKHIMPMSANTTHGLKNNPADFYKMLSFIAEKKHPRDFMKNDFELDIPTIALNIKASQTILEAVHNKYKGPKDAPHPTLSQQLKAKRDEAIIEAYGEEGMSANAIAKKFNIKSHKTVLRVIEECEARWAESEKRGEERRAAEEAEWVERAAKHGYGAHEVERFKQMADLLENYDDNGRYIGNDEPTAPPVVLPMADTSDRSATRADPDEVRAKHMANVDRIEAKAASASAPFDIKSLGWGDGPGSNAKAVRIADMDAEKLQEAWKQNQVVKKRADRKHAELLAAAAKLGISLEG